MSKFDKGSAAACEDMTDHDFDTDQAIASFRKDLAEGEYQRGYLCALVKSGEALEDWRIQEMNDHDFAHYHNQRDGN